MFKKHVAKVLVAVALLVAVVGMDVAGEPIGMLVTSEAGACSVGAGSGGGC